MCNHVTHYLRTELGIYTYILESKSLQVYCNFGNHKIVEHKNYPAPACMRNNRKL